MLVLVLSGVASEGVAASEVPVLGSCVEDCGKNVSMKFTDCC